ncbi:MAG TPA: VIT1/CCC1 transporter family protein [Dehalococcoidia bacterium]|nr:VIT1/CCC1 transporter family protein [Dehalococcoidia bacterium]
MTTEDKPKATPADIKRFQTNLDDEINGIAIYHMLRDAESDPKRKEIFAELAEVEVHHADVWRAKLREAGVEPREHGPSLRTRFIGFLARRFGVRSVLPIVRNMEAGAYVAYMGQGEAGQAIAPDEREHRKTMSRLEKPNAEPTDVITQRETWHRTGGGGTLRASVFGVSDGLVSNASLVMGFAGAQTKGDVALLAGVAGLLAGAFSMAAGEYVSMRAQRELFERQIDLERQELEMSPGEEEREIALIYQAKGISKEQAEAMAAQLMKDPEVALNTLVKEELGLDPSELGSPWGAAIGSFLAFAGGAIVPVIPFIFAPASKDVSVGIAALSAGLSGLALFGVGAALALFTGRSPLFSGGRQLALGAAAAALTFAIGNVIGVSTGG